MGDLRVHGDPDLDQAIAAAIKEAALREPLPDASRVLARPLALVEARARRRRLLTAAGLSVGFAATLLVGVLTWHRFRPDNGGRLLADTAGALPETIAAPPAAPLIDGTPFDEPSGDGSPAATAADHPTAISMKEAMRQTDFPLYVPRAVPDGVVLVGISVESQLDVRFHARARVAGGMPAADTDAAKVADAPKVAKVIMRYKGPGDGRLQLQQVGPMPQPASTVSTAEVFAVTAPDWLDKIDNGSVRRLEWFDQGVLFEIRSNWDEEAARRFAQSLQPVEIDGGNQSGEANSFH